MRDNRPNKQTVQRKQLSARMNAFLKFVPIVCAIGVAAAHCRMDSPPMGKGEVWVANAVSYGVAPATVPIFLMLSGFLFFLTADSMRSVAQKMKRRIFTVLIPFLAWSTAYYVLFNAKASLLGSTEMEADWSPLGILKGIVFYKYAYAMWFMFILIGLVILSPVIYWILKNRAAVIAVLAIAAAASVLQSVLQLNLEVTVDGDDKALFAWNCFLSYFFGCAAARCNYEKWIDRLVRVPYPVVIAGLAVTGTLDTMIFAGFIPCFNERIAVPFVTVLTLILFLKVADRHPDMKLGFLPSIPTMVVYGIHPLVALAVLKVLERLPIPMMAVYLLRVILTLAVSCGAAVLIRKIKPFNFLFNGNRK